MFQRAYSIYKQCLCSFGGGDRETKPRIFGYSCLLSPTHVITAAHIVREMRSRQFWTVVFAPQGAYRCEVIFSDEEVDIAILQLIEQIASCEGKPCTTFPLLSQNKLRMGMTVGYLTRLECILHLV